MKFEEGKFYFIKDCFFEQFKEFYLMENRDNGNKRPCFFCFKDKKYKEIIWFVPISTKYEKYKSIYEKKKLNFPNKPVYNFVFGSVLNKKTVFLIQNIFPTTKNYILEKYKTSDIDVDVPVVVKKEIIDISSKIIALAEHGTCIPFYDIIEMRNKLLNK